MKKIIFVLAACLSVMVLFTACKESKKKEIKVEEAAQENHADVTYQCPMDCEEGKTYDEAGSCPVCKMDLKAMASDGAEPESHTADCACKKGGECQCEDGKCACKSAVSEKKECTKCAPGECGCKAETAAKKSACSAACKSGKAQKA